MASDKLIVRWDFTYTCPTPPCQDCRHFRPTRWAGALGQCDQIDAELTYCLAACCDKFERAVSIEDGKKHTSRYGGGR